MGEWDRTGREERGFGKMRMPILKGYDVVVWKRNVSVTDGVWGMRLLRGA